MNARPPQPDGLDRAWAARGRALARTGGWLVGLFVIGAAGGVPAGGVPAGEVPAGGIPAGGVPAGGIVAGGIVAAQQEAIERSGERDSSSPLPSYLHAAELHNPGIAAAKQLSLAAQQEPAVSGAWPEPQVSYAHFIETLETRVGPQEYRASLAQRIPWFGSLGAARSASEARAEKTVAQEDASRQRLFHDVKRTYYDLHFTATAIDVINRQVALLDQLVEVARTRYTTGRGSQAALLRLQMRSQELEDAVDQRWDEWDSHRARMNALLGGVVVATGIPPGGGDEDGGLGGDEDGGLGGDGAGGDNRGAEGNRGDADASVRSAFPLPPVDYPALLKALSSVTPEANPALEQIAALERESEALVRLAEKRTYPDLTVGVQYLATGDALDPTMPDSGKDPWLLSVSMELPLWWGQHRAAREKARAQRRARQLQWQDETNRLSAEIEEARNRLRTQQRSIELFESSLLPLAEQATDVTVRDYSGGRVSYVEVIDAQQAQLALELELARARADRGQSLAHLERLLGRPLHDAHASQPVSEE